VESGAGARLTCWPRRQAAWATGTAPAAAAEQRRAEAGALAGGERALHWLETLPPAAAWDALAPLAAGAAAAALSRCRGAALPPAAAALDRCARSRARRLCRRV
jgi:hypothetical protein